MTGKKFGNTTLKAVGSIITFLFVVILALYGSSRGRDVSNNLADRFLSSSEENSNPVRSTSDTQKLLKNLTDEINETLPRIDNDIRMDSVSFREPLSLLYTFTLITHESHEFDIGTAQSNAIKDHTMTTACKPNEMLPLLDKDVTLKFQYLAIDGVILTMFTINLTDCLSANN